MSELERVDDLGSAWLRAWVGESGFATCCAHDVQYEDPLAKDPLRGLDALEEHAARLREALPDLRIERSGEMLARGAYVCVPWRAAGTHKGGTPTLPATNHFVEIGRAHV